MMDYISKYTKELLSLINLSEPDKNQFNRIKDLICFLSEKRKNYSIPSKDVERVENVLYYASQKMRTFGYNRLNGFDNDIFNVDGMSKMKTECIESYYKTMTGFVLDKLQKQVLDAFEESEHKLFLSAPTSFGKTFLLKEIIYRNYNKYDNIVIVLPTVALLMEVTEDLNAFFKNQNLQYSTYNSVYRDLELSGKNVFILTPERVLRLLALKPNLDIDFFFFDEIYKIDEDISLCNEEDMPNDLENKIGTDEKNKNCKENHRVTAFRLALYFLLRITPECYIAGPFIKLKGLKQGFLKMLNKYKVGKIEINFEPTLKNRIYYTSSKFKEITPFGQNVQAAGKKNGIEKLEYIVEKLDVGKKNPAIVFCLYPGYTEKYARKYSSNLKEENNKLISLFIDHVIKNYNCRFDGKRKNSTDNWDFLFALKRGVGIHNGKFPRYFQREIMSLYNQKQLPILFCTSTIVEGVNTNAKTVIVYNNPSGQNDAGRKFLLLNINGRAGRYLKHFVGNVVYINKDSEKIESSNDISLDFKFFNDKVLLKDIDLENVYDEDLSPENLIKKHQLNINKAFLPDDIFEQNRLIERKKQEQILEWIYKPKYLRKFSGIENVGIGEFIDNGYFDAILEIWSLIGEIKESQIIGIKFFSKKYANEGYPGVLQYEFDRYNKSSDKEDAIRKYVNDTYRDVFRKVKDTVEYQLPRIISLFETLIGYAFKTKGLLTKDTLDLSNIIRYFEVGAKTLLGADMVEKGVPVITVRKIEKRKIEGNNLTEQKEYFYKHLFNYTLFLDAYEKELLKRYR